MNHLPETNSNNARESPLHPPPRSLFLSLSTSYPRFRTFLRSNELYTRQYKIFTQILSVYYFTFFFLYFLRIFQVNFKKCFLFFFFTRNVNTIGIILRLWKRRFRYRIRLYYFAAAKSKKRKFNFEK